MIDRNGKLYQIAVNCYKGTNYGRRTYVSKECDFIEEVTKKEVKCESIDPIHEQPTTTTIILSQTQTLIASNPQSSSSKIGLEMALFIIFVALLCL
uniref:Uncharacterized protein n=1 Tax=Panagrolaimus davidi TaxID=227884 RepID=A0A914QAY1_9BILA